MLVALTLRQAFAAMSPILGDIPISNTGVGLLGTLPPILLAGSAVALAGTGIGNALLPPIVRRYFPDRVALLTAVYGCIVGVSTAVPVAVVAPVAEQIGWRFSLGMWAANSVVALVPWIVVLARERRRRLSDDFAVESPPSAVLTRLWRSRVAVSITVLFSTSTICTYASFALLPEILGDIAGSTPTEAGVLLAVTGLISAPGALIVPLLVVRMRNVGWLIDAAPRASCSATSACSSCPRHSHCSGCCSSVSARGRSSSRSASCSSTIAPEPTTAPSHLAASPKESHTRSARSVLFSSGCCET